MKTINYLIITFLFSIGNLLAVPGDDFKPMQITLDKDVDPIVLREKIREVVAGAVEAFIKRNQKPDFQTIAVLPCLKDVDGYASKELEDVIATLGPELGVSVVAKGKVRESLVKVIANGQRLEGIIDGESIPELGRMLNCQVLVVPDLEIIQSKSGRVSLEMDFSPYDVTRGVRLAGQGKDPVLAYIEPVTAEPSFMEKHGTKVWIGLGLLILFIIIKTITGAVRRASRPR